MLDEGKHCNQCCTQLLHLSVSLTPEQASEAGSCAGNWPSSHQAVTCHPLGCLVHASSGRQPTLAPVWR